MVLLGVDIYKVQKGFKDLSGSRGSVGGIGGLGLMLLLLRIARGRSRILLLGHWRG